MFVKIRFLLSSLALAASLVLPPSTAVAAPADAPSPGTVTASAPFQHLLPANASARVLTYSTTREDGSPVAATATLYEPTAAWTHSGPRPTIIFAPGHPRPRGSLRTHQGPGLPGPDRPAHVVHGH